MTKRRLPNCNGHSVQAPVSASRPGDFPIGSSESRAAARFALFGVSHHPDAETELGLGTLSSVERALIQGIPDASARRCVVRLYRSALDRAEIYGLPLPPLVPERLRHNREDAVRSGILHFG